MISEAELWRQMVLTWAMLAILVISLIRIAIETIKDFLDDQKKKRKEQE
jgi:hypothetical protein